jgi:hypothetical protein
MLPDNVNGDHVLSRTPTFPQASATLDREQCLSTQFLRSPRARLQETALECFWIYSRRRLFVVYKYCKLFRLAKKLKC